MTGLHINDRHVGPGGFFGFDEYGRQPGVVSSSQAAAFFIPAVKVRKLDSEYSRLDLINTPVDAHILMVIFDTGTVVSEHFGLFSQVRIGGNYYTRLSVGSRFLVK
jgi:hypothetical protein